MRPWSGSELAVLHRQVVSLSLARPPDRTCRWRIRKTAAAPWSPLVCRELSGTLTTKHPIEYLSWATEMGSRV